MYFFALTKYNAIINSKATVPFITALISANMCGSKPNFTSILISCKTITAINTISETDQIIILAFLSFFVNTGVG